MNPGPYDDRGDEEGGESRRSGLVAVVVGVAALLGFGIAMWYAYDLGVRSGGDGAIPVVSAPEGPAKRRPVEEGGIDVPFQDKLVYERLNNPAPAAEPVERLLPPPEMPMERPAAPPEPTPPETPAEASPVLPPLELPAAPPPGTSTAPPETSPPPATPPDAVAPTTPPAAPTPAQGDVIRVQLASVRSDSDARETWERLRKNHEDLLGKFSLHVDRVDLGAERGVYYRVQAGPVSEASLAQLLCGQLKSRGVECFVVK